MRSVFVDRSTTTEVTPLDQKRKSVKVDDVSKRSRKKRCCRETSMTVIRSPKVVMFPLQRLYMACLDAFKGVGTVPSLTTDRNLRSVLNGLMPEDVGLPRKLQFLDPDSTVVYTTIYQCQNFSLYLFFLPENAVIPLHNHPEMTVFSKLLLGKVHIKAYDLVNPDIADNNPSSSQLKLACLKADSVFTAPCDSSVLYPTIGGNIHAFTAITPCAILDVVGPPYSKNDGRDCSYYRDIPHPVAPYEQMIMPEDDGNCYRWLEEIEMPKESEMDRIEYLGPQIIEVN